MYIYGGVGIEEEVKKIDNFLMQFKIRRDYVNFLLISLVFGKHKKKLFDQFMTYSNVSFVTIFKIQ